MCYYVVLEVKSLKPFLGVGHMKANGTLVISARGNKLHSKAIETTATKIRCYVKTRRIYENQARQFLQRRKYSQPINGKKVVIQPL